MILYCHPSQYHWEPGFLVWEKEDICKTKLSKKNFSPDVESEMPVWTHDVFLSERKEDVFLSSVYCKGSKTMTNSAQWALWHPDCGLEIPFSMKSIQSSLEECWLQAWGRACTRWTWNICLSQGRSKGLGQPQEALTCTAGRTGSLVRVKTAPGWIAL